MSQTLNDLLKAKGQGMPTLSASTDDDQSARPVREKKKDALNNKVWLASKKRPNNAPQGGNAKRPKQASKPTSKAKGNPAKEVATAGKRVRGTKQSMQIIESEDNNNEDVEEDLNQSGEDGSEFDEGEEEPEESDGEQFNVDDEALNNERVETIRDGKKKKKGGKVQVDDDDIIVPDIDSKSDASSALDLSQLPSDDEDEVETQPKPENTRKASCRDAKYDSERPSIKPAPTPPTPSTTVMVSQTPSTITTGSITTSVPSNSTNTTVASNGSSNATSESFNSNWAAVTHMVFPAPGQRTISKKAQSPVVKAVLDLAISLACGLTVFDNSFANAAAQLQNCVVGLNAACANTQQPLIQDRIQRDPDYRKHLVNYIFGRVGHLRGQVKTQAAKVVSSQYDFMRLSKSERATVVKKLMDRLTYIFPLSDPSNPSTWRKNEPYRHQCIVTVLHLSFFKGSTSIANRHPDSFTSISSDDNRKEIPKSMLALAGTAIFAALKEWETGDQVEEDFSAKVFVEEYNKHLTMLEGKILRPDNSGKEKYHRLMAHLYEQASKKSSSASIGSELPDIDFDAME
ncbi:hypothetical protein D9758_018658 [Tetrapyrgos nigripes]|uniref:DUF6532 domain-containing protein n=1 Tax=Tetrapyrgos nigripes TaxID=182062 RepID=A0A8H5EYN9_9AGAR|nr:hypothetical protein D9758_018658 [Tetrapyrgos nigripes]